MNIFVSFDGKSGWHRRTRSMCEALDSRYLLSGSVAGEWQGTRSAHGNVYTNSATITLDLVQTGTSVSGTEHIAVSGQPQYYADYTLKGSVNGSTFNFSNTSILKSNSPPRSTFYLVSYSLQVNSSGTSMSGNWDNGNGAAGGISVTKVPTSKVALTEATTVDARSVTVDYTISNTNVSQPLLFDVYRSDKDVLDSSSKLLGSETLSPSTDAGELTQGNHTVKLIPGTSLAPNTKMPYIIVVADKNGAVNEAAGSVNTVYFQKFLLGAISHGLIPLGGILVHTVPAWESSTANDLLYYDNYSAVLPFDWVSTSNKIASGQAVAAGNSLYAMVVARADQLAAAHLGDVVDLHFIGHSRGAVVVNQAIQDLVGTKNPALEGSYIKETLLDPHPANKQTLGLYSAVTSGYKIIAAYEAFEEIAADPQIVIPSNVKYAEIYYQKSSYSKFPKSTFGEYAINLWGEGPADGIGNKSASPIHWAENLSNLNDPTPSPHLGTPIGPIGHSEVPLWYEAHVVDKKLAAST